MHPLPEKLLKIALSSSLVLVRVTNFLFLRDNIASNLCFLKLVQLTINWVSTYSGDLTSALPENLNYIFFLIIENGFCSLL